MKNQLILTVDLDEWYHCRWATGSKISRWKDTRDCFRDYYKSDRPIGEIIEPTRRILKILRGEKIKATFFVLGEVALWYPELVRQIAKAGHEIACHGMHHVDMTLLGRERFEKELKKSREILENLINREVLGFRSPNLIIKPWLQEILIKQKFLFDSSICPSRSIQGKYKGQIGTPVNPYRIGENILNQGNSELFEIPIPSFPVLKLPGAVSIATRIFGLRWTFITMESALKTGAACYYLHPYEFHNPPELSNVSLYQRIFMWRMGEYMENSFKRLLYKYRGRVLSCQEYLVQNEKFLENRVTNAKKIFKNRIYKTEK